MKGPPVFDPVQNAKEREQYLALMATKRAARNAKRYQRRMLLKRLEEQYPWANIEDLHMEDGKLAYRLVSKRPLSRGGRQRWHSPLF